MTNCRRKALALAKKIADDLFTNGFGQEAERLVITSATGADLGGWCKSAIIGRVRDFLAAALKPQPPSERGLRRQRAK